MAIGWHDLFYFRDGVGYRLRIELETDAGSFLDITPRYHAGDLKGSPYPGGSRWTPSYYNALPKGREPKVSVGSSGGDSVYVASSGILQLDNTPWAGHDYGFWDAPFPVHLYHGSTKVTFSTWFRRRVRLHAEIYHTDSGFFETQPIGTFLIRRVQTNPLVATIQLIGAHERLAEKSADSIKSGAEWLQGIPIGTLANIIVALAANDLDRSVLAGNRVDLGTLSSARTSSWGPAPGYDSDGHNIAHEWISRCIGPDMMSHSSKVIVGFEVPGNKAESQGGLAQFNFLTGSWKVICTPDSDGFDEAFPIWAWSDDPLYIYVMLMKPQSNANWAYGFYKVKFVRVKRSDGTVNDESLWKSYWPARWNMRKGHLFPGIRYEVGEYVTGHHCGDALLLPFAQKVSSLMRDINGVTTGLLGHAWHGYKYDSSKASPKFYSSIEPPEFSAQECGNYGVRVVANPANPTQTGAHLLFWWKDLWHPPLLIGDGEHGVSHKKWTFWIGLTGQSWKMCRFLANDAGGGNLGQYEEWNLSFGGGDEFHDAQVCAYCLAPDTPHGTPGSQGFDIVIATIEWDESDSGSAQLSTSRLLMARMNDPGGSYPPGGNAYTWLMMSEGGSRAFVHLWTPPEDTYDDYYAETYGGDFLMVVVFDRSDLTGRPFILYQVDISGGTGSYMSDSARPRSSRPFCGFTFNHNDGRVYFLDPGTGQVMSGVMGSANWRIENDAVPVHTSDKFLTTATGCYAYYSALSEAFIFWGLGPTMDGEVTNPYFYHDEGKPAWSRYVPGIYPWVQLSTKVSDTIDVAYLKGMNCWEALKRLKELAPGYQLGVERDGEIVLKKRTAGVTKGTLKLRSNWGTINPGDGDIPFEGYASKRVMTDEVINAVIVTPYEVVYNEPEQPQKVKGPGSLFDGKYRVEVSTKRTVNLQLLCVSGGDIVLNDTGEEGENSLLFRYMRVLETITAHLLTPATADDYVIYVGGMVSKAGRIYSGEQQIRTGDTVQVSDGLVRTIMSLESDDDVVQVKITLNAAIGNATVLPNGADTYAPVKITPSGGEASDGDDGVSILWATLPIGQTHLVPLDTDQFQVGQAIEIGEELLKVTGKRWVSANSRQGLSVSRGQWGTTDAIHYSGDPIKAYVAVGQSNRLYPVGDTGVSFGIQYEEPTEPEPEEHAEVQRRCVCIGDGVIVRSSGYSMRAMEHAIVVAEDSASIKLLNRKEKPVSGNPLMDPVKASLVAQELLTQWAWPRLGVFGLKMSMWLDLEVGDMLDCSEPQIVPETEAPVTFEVTAVRYDMKAWMMEIDIRSWDPIEGAGGQLPAARVGGFGVKRGKRRYVAMPG